MRYRSENDLLRDKVSFSSTMLLFFSPSLSLPLFCVSTYPKDASVPLRLVIVRCLLFLFYSFCFICSSQTLPLQFLIYMFVPFLLFVFRFFHCWYVCFAYLFIEFVLWVFVYWRTFSSRSVISAGAVGRSGAKRSRFASNFRFRSFIRSSFENDWGRRQRSRRSSPACLDRQSARRTREKVRRLFVFKKKRVKKRT